jgi:aromatic-L-amino-acid/L-tryptophan decarboxylase
MDPETFRRHGHALVDWIARYMAEVERYPVLSQVDPGAVRAALPPSPPVTGEPFEAMLADVERVILPGLTHWQHPAFFAYFPANASGPAILGELLSAGLGVQGMLWATSPACTELETHVLDWLVEMLDLPPAFHSSGAGGGVIQDTASSAALCALIAARERATGERSNREGSPPGLVAYASREAHSSVEKACGIAGIGRDGLRLVDTDATHALDPEALQGAIARDRAAGRQPFFVAATVGTTSSTAIDPVPAIGTIARREGLWLHVDAAHAGAAAVCPELRPLQAGLEHADSYCFNPHKWLLTNFDCDCFWVADRGALVRSLSVLPEYLRNRATESGAVLDYRDWEVPLGRRFRALKLWFVIRHYGVSGLQAHIRHHVHLARAFAAWVEADPAFELAAPVPLNLVCFRHLGGDEVNQRLLDRLNASGELYLTHTRLDGLLTLRLAIGGTHTGRRHVEAAWERIRRLVSILE